jgi:hypothetical protein
VKNIPENFRASLHALADWIADQAERARTDTAPRVPTVNATEEEREFARDELRAMKTPKRRRRAG